MCNVRQYIRVYMHTPGETGITCIEGKDLRDFKRLEIESDCHGVTSRDISEKNADGESCVIRFSFELFDSRPRRRAQNALYEVTIDLNAISKLGKANPSENTAVTKGK